MTYLFVDRRRLLAILGLGPATTAVAAATAAAPARAVRPPVRVLFTRVNGERYYDAAQSLPTLERDDPVTLRRESENPYDRRAIAVLDDAGRKLGYVARIDNSAVARMMDAGERFQARVARLDRAAVDIHLVVEWLPA